MADFWIVFGYLNFYDFFGSVIVERPSNYFFSHVGAEPLLPGY